MSELLALGVSHKTAPLARARAAGAARGRRRSASCASSCGRRRSPRPSRSRPATAPSSTSSRRPSRGRDDARWGAGPPGRIRPTELARLYALRNCDAARHLYRVTSRPGVDDRRRGRGPGPGPARLRARAGRAAPPARSPTGSSARPWPRASACAPRPRSARAAVARPRSRSSSARQSLGELGDRRGVLVLGAGETGRAAARPLTCGGARRSSWPPAGASGRWPLAAALRRLGRSLRRLAGELEAADIVVTATASPHAIMGRRSCAVMEARCGRPLLLIDLAVPRDIDPACPAGVAGVTLLDMDALQAQVPASRRPPHRGGARRGDMRITFSCHFDASRCDVFVERQNKPKILYTGEQNEYT